MPQVERRCRVKVGRGLQVVEIHACESDAAYPHAEGPVLGVDADRFLAEGVGVAALPLRLLGTGAMDGSPGLQSSLGWSTTDHHRLGCHDQLCVTGTGAGMSRIFRSGELTSSRLVSHEQITTIHRVERTPRAVPSTPPSMPPKGITP